MNIYSKLTSGKYSCHLASKRTKQRERNSTSYHNKLEKNKRIHAITISKEVAREGALRLRRPDRVASDSRHGDDAKLTKCNDDVLRVVEKYEGRRWLGTDDDGEFWRIPASTSI